MLYLIGLGLNKKGISVEGLEEVKRCKKVYLENYTVDFPYNLQELEEVVGKKVIPLDRSKVENLEFIDEAEKKNITLLVYGSPLIATTHITILDEAKKSGIKTKVIHAGSVLDGIAESGLQLYKFGKITSMPAWKKSYKPDSFIEIVKENKKIESHSLILIDIGLDFDDAINQLQKASEKHEIKFDKIILCQAIGTKKSRIYYKHIKELKEIRKVVKPYCIIIPGKLHHVEEEFLEYLS